MIGSNGSAYVISRISVSGSRECAGKMVRQESLLSSGQSAE